MMQTLVEHALQDAFVRALVNPERIPPLVLPSSDEDAYPFFAHNLPYEMTISFLKRVHSKAKCSDSVIICALVLLDRIAEKDPRLIITPYTGRRLLITAILIATKVNEEEQLADNEYYAKIGSFKFPSEMNGLEISMLKILDFKVLVSYEEFQDKLKFAFSKMGLVLKGSGTAEKGVSFTE